MFMADFGLLRRMQNASDSNNIFALIVE